MMSSAFLVDGRHKVLEVLSGRIAPCGPMAPEGFVPEGA